METSKPIEAHLKDMDSFFYGGNRWQAGLYQLIQDLTLDQVMWKPTSERHCIWEVVKHVHFWKTYASAIYLNKPQPDWETGNWAKISSFSFRKKLEARFGRFKNQP